MSVPPSTTVLIPTHRHKDPPVPATSNAPSPSQVCGPTQRLGSGRLREERADRGNRVKAHGDWGLRVPPACAQVCATQVRAPKAVAFHASAVPKQKAEPSLPRAAARFSTRRALTCSGLGTDTVSLGWQGVGWTPLPLVPVAPRALD